jgi:sialate O-acetylesterase
MNYKILLLIFFVSVIEVSNAQLKVASYFKDHLILQRNVENQIWGTATGKEKITLKINETSSTSEASPDGNWYVTIPAKSEGGPFSVEIITAKEKITLSDLYFGDVWLCSGQSNMEYAVGAFPWGKDELKAVNKTIRFLEIPNRIDEVPVDELPADIEWKVASGEDTQTLSAVAYWFAKHLQSEIDVPIGLITSDWSGTAIEPWMSVPMLKPFPQFKEVISDLEDDPKPHAQIENEFQEYLKNEWGPKYYYKGIGFNEEWYDLLTDYSSWDTIHLPTWWEESGISGLKYHDGAVWFRTTFDLPQNFSDSLFYVDLNLIDDYDILWINGVKVGETFGNQNWRQYWVPRNILKQHGNSLVLRVFDVGGNGGLNFHPLWSNFILNGKWVCKKGESISRIVPVPRIVNKSPYGYPTAVFNAMIYPLLKTNVKGVIWYQGESNEARAQEYAQLFPAMIKGWRKDFAQGDFPFYFVQLANFDSEAASPNQNSWSELREGQEAALDLPNTGMAVAIDIGEAADIHPANKMEVGRRLALHALKNQYNKKTTAQSPVFKSMEINNDSVLIYIETFGDSLVCNDKYGYVNGFAIAAEGQEFIWAKAQLKGNKIIVYNGKVKQPADVRYAWSKNPGKLNVYNTEGLPLRPFRTDRRPGVTEGREFDLNKVFY